MQWRQFELPRKAVPKSRRSRLCLRGKEKGHLGKGAHCLQVAARVVNEAERLGHVLLRDVHLEASEVPESLNRGAVGSEPLRSALGKVGWRQVELLFGKGVGESAGACQGQEQWTCRRGALEKWREQLRVW